MLSDLNGHSAPATPDPEVLARPKRRRVNAEYKQRIVLEAGRCTEPGQIGALLRREGLYSSHLVEWRRSQQMQGRSSRIGRPAAPHITDQNRQLRRENAQLKRRLAQADAIIELQKKVSDLLGITLAETPDDGSGS
jgi:transposase